MSATTVVRTVAVLFAGASLAACHTIDQSSPDISTPEAPASSQTTDLYAFRTIGPLAPSVSCINGFVAGDSTIGPKDVQCAPSSRAKGEYIFTTIQPLKNGIECIDGRVIKGGTDMRATCVKVPDSVAAEALRAEPAATQTAPSGSALPVPVSCKEPYVNGGLFGLLIAGPVDCALGITFGPYAYYGSPFTYSSAAMAQGIYAPGGMPSRRVDRSGNVIECGPAYAPGEWGGAVSMGMRCRNLGPAGPVVR